MRILSSLTVVAIVRCAHSSATVSDPVTNTTPEPVAAATSDAAAAPAPVAAAAPVPQPAAPVVAAIPAERRAVQSANAPKAVGPYSHAIQAPADRVVFLSGQIAVDPVKDRLIAGNAAKQTERVMQNLKAVLDAAGASFDDVVKTTIFLTDLADFNAVNEMYGRYFQKTPPARATLQMAALPRGARIEIEFVAATGRSGRVGAVQSAPASLGSYSQSVGVSPASFLFVSGQIPLDPVTGQPIPGDIGVQTSRVMENLKAVLEAGGASFEKVVKTTIFVADMADVAKINEAYARYFQKMPPARAIVQVAALPRGARVEIDCVAAL